jgi:signal transduction histidine kinase
VHLLKSPVFFEVLAQEAIMGIMAFDLNSLECIYINKLAREMLEFSSHELSKVEIALSNLYPKDARSGVRAFNAGMIHHEGLLQDVLIAKANETTFIANLGIKNLALEDGSKLLLLMFQDVTYQKKLQREINHKQEEIRNAYIELLEQNKQLKELDLAKDKFIALTTHELRTPLSAIVATADALNLKLYDTPEQMADFVRTIYEQGIQLMELVNDVLDFAKIRAGKMDYYIEKQPLASVLTAAGESFQQMAEHSQVTLDVHLPDSDVHAYFDLMRLREVVNNVVNNAIKYNRKNGHVRIEIEQTQEGFASIVITDTGQGIPSDKLENVFNEFETVGSVSRHHKGTGLGMPISRRLIQAMGGDLRLSSEENIGSRFSIDIPLAKVLAEEFYRSRPDVWGDLAA